MVRQTLEAKFAEALAKAQAKEVLRKANAARHLKLLEGRLAAQERKRIMARRLELGTLLTEPGLEDVSLSLWMEIAGVMRDLRQQDSTQLFSLSWWKEVSNVMDALRQHEPNQLGAWLDIALALIKESPPHA